MKVNAGVQTLKADQASQNMEEVLADPQTVQHLRDWRTASGKEI